MWPFALMRKYNFPVFKNKVMWEIFGPKKYETSGKWEVVRKYEFYGIMLHFLLAFSHIQSCPSRTGRLLRQLLLMPATDIWPYAETIIKFFKSTLDDKVPRYIQGIYF